jgi:GGDEF domain-containing protein/HAMP domain-containing protein
VGGKFLITIGIVIPAVMGIAVVGVVGVQTMHRSTLTLTDERLRGVQASADLVSATYALHETALLQLAADTPAMDASVTAELDQSLIPRFESAVSVIERDDSGRADDLAKVRQIVDGLQAYLRLRQTDSAQISSRTSSQTSSRTSSDTSAGAGLLRRDAQTRTALAERIDAIFTAMVDTGEQLRSQEAARAAQTRLEADQTYHRTLIELGLGVLGVLVLTLTVSLVLIRNLVPRIRTYSHFAAQVAAGRTGERLTPRGADELTDLGLALNAMVDQRERLSTVEQAQAEFVDILQITGTEDEAQALMRRHLERSIAAEAVVLRRNNSANRLEAATALSPQDPLTARLVGAEPRSCAALRLGKTHREGTGRAQLLTCTVCTDRDAPSTCEPLLVGGTVIGSVLVTYTGTPDPGDESLIRNTVAQAAPMLANLRNLALAEFRANSDALTGLPNRRATDDTLKRMVAQASRSLSPLTAAMLDLDHFKQINDRFGHGKGDEVLAAVGATIQGCLRAGDFAGRFGGEEFLILLPDTDDCRARRRTPTSRHCGHHHRRRRTRHHSEPRHR